MSSSVHTLADYAAACGDALVACWGEPSTVIQSLTHDSRAVGAGALFVAIDGAQVDGRKFIEDAIAQGAAAVAYAGPARELPVPSLQLQEDYRALGRMAALFFGHPSRELRLCGVTGTNGKTTVSTLIHHVLSARAMTGLIGTVVYNTGQHQHPADRTTPMPLTLQSLLAEMRDGDCQDAVLEMSSHALVQDRIGSAQFSVAVFTNLTGDHLDFHVSMEAYYLAKQTLFTALLAPSGIAVVNIDDAYGQRLVDDLQAAIQAGDFGVDVWTYGFAESANFHPQKCHCHVGGSELLVATPTGNVELRSPLVGRFNVSNLLAATAAAMAMGVAPGMVAASLAEFPGVTGRLQRLEGANGVTVFVDYAHTDDALRQVLTTLRGVATGRLRVLFGCGGDRDRSKRARMGTVAVALADDVVVTSDNPRTEEPAAIIAEILEGCDGDVPVRAESDRRAAIRLMMASAMANDTILVAGKGHEDYQEINGETLPFDDVAECRAAMASSRLL